MKHLVEFPLEEGGAALIEVQTDTTAGMTPAVSLASSLDEVKVEFGIKVDTAITYVNSVINFKLAARVCT